MREVVIIRSFYKPSLCSLEPLESRTLLASTSDPSFSQQYALANTSVSSAWDLTRGSATVVAAVIDTGIDYTHPDLSNNVWINQAEIPPAVKSKLKDVDGDGRISFYDLNHSTNRPHLSDGNRNGVIDAGDLLRPISQGGWEDRINGKSNANDVYVDDIVGWDFAENDNKPMDDAPASGHGTHVAGIVGAVGNNGRGISGVIQKVSMMILRIFDDYGSAVSDSRIAQAIRYAADSGARIANASWGSSGGRNGDVIYNAINYARGKGQLFVAAAGNGAANLDSSRSNFFPAEYDLDNVLVVASTTSSRRLSSFSNYGQTKVDLAAPGSDLLSTLPGNRYGRMSGTSMAAPMVTGAAALMLANNRALTFAQLKQRLIAGANQSTSLKTRSVSGGELHVNNAIRNRTGTRVASTLTASSTLSTSSTSSKLTNVAAATPFSDLDVLGRRKMDHAW